MEDAGLLAERFEAARPRLGRMAQRILGSVSESDDALQETWLRIHGADVVRTVVQGADAVAESFSGRARAAQAVFIDGEPGAVWMDANEVRVAFRFRISGELITAIDLIADRAALAQSVIERQPDQLDRHVQVDAIVNMWQGLR